MIMGYDNYFALHKKAVDNSGRVWLGLGGWQSCCFTTIPEVHIQVSGVKVIYKYTDYLYHEQSHIHKQDIRMNLSSTKNIILRGMNGKLPHS
jgi:hypothetical protein